MGSLLRIVLGFSCLWVVERLITGGGSHGIYDCRDWICRVSVLDFWLSARAVSWCDFGSMRKIRVFEIEDGAQF